VCSEHTLLGILKLGLEDGGPSLSHGQGQGWRQQKLLSACIHGQKGVPLLSPGSLKEHGIAQP